MVQSTQTADITIRDRSSDDDQWIVDLRNRLADHLPPMTVAGYRHWLAIDQVAENAHNERFVAERDGQRVAAFSLEKMWWVTKPGGFFCSIQVVPDGWCQGVGSKVYDHLVQRVRDLGGDRIYGNVREDRAPAQTFAEHRGFTKTGHSDRYSCLEVAKANLDGYEGVEERLAAEGIVMKTLAEIKPDEAFLRKLHAASDEAVRDIPMSEQFTETPFEMFLKELEDPNLTYDTVWVALDGQEPVGLAIFPLPTPTAAFNGFTGVVRAARGKGVARALKYKTVAWSRENGVEKIFTANDINNKRMLSINISLGYKPLPSSEEVVKELAG